MTKRSAIMSISLLILLSFLSISFSQDPVQTRPETIRTKPGQVPSDRLEKAKILELPDMVVDSIWLDRQCNINFKLKNSGPENVPDGEHRESVVRVQFGSEIKDFPLPKIDPNGVLKRAGGLVSFNTQIRLKSSVDVKVMVDFNHKIKETEAGEKNNEKPAKLTPQCPSTAQDPHYKLDKDKGQLQFGDGSKGKALPQGDKSIKVSSYQTGEGTKTQKIDMSLQKTPWQIGTPLPQSSGKKSDTAPIKISILSPTQNSSWDIGSNLNIQWKALPLPKAFHVFLFSKPNDITAAAIISQFKTFKPDQQGIFSDPWKIPSYIKPGDYVVKIIYADDPSVWTASDFFKIKGGLSLIPPKPLYAGPPVKGFKVDYPDKTDLWMAGENHNIIWSYLPSVLNDAKAYEDMMDLVRIVLKDGSGAQRLIISQSAKNQKPVYPEGMTPPNTTSSSMWTIPKDLTDGKYTIRIETPDGHFFGESEPFTIWSPKIVMMEPGKKTIQKSFPSDDPAKKFFGGPKGVPVQVIFKLVSVTPHMSGNHEIAWVDFTAEIDANTEFRFGDYSAKDPILEHVLVKPEMKVELRWVEPGTTKYVGGALALEYFGYLGDMQWIYPTGVLKKGKNLVKFMITASVFNKPNLGPLRVNGYKEYWEGKTQITKTCHVDWDLHGEVWLWLSTKSSPEKNGKSIDFFEREPRKEVWIQGLPTWGDCK